MEFRNLIFLKKSKLMSYFNTLQIMASVTSAHGEATVPSFIQCIPLLIVNPLSSSAYEAPEPPLCNIGALKKITSLAVSAFPLSGIFLLSIFYFKPAV